MGLFEGLKKKSLSNLLIYGFGQVFNLITPFLVIPYIVFVCGETGLGKAATGLNISFLLIVIIDYAVDIVGVKEVSVNRNNKEKLENILSTIYFSKALLLTTTLAVACLIFITVPFFYAEKALFLLGLPILVGQFINPGWIFQGIENFKWTAILNIVSKLIYVGGVFYFVKQEGDYIYINLMWGAGMIVANLIGFVYLRTKYAISLKRTSFPEAKSYLRNNFSIFVSQVFLSLQLYSPLILVSFFLGDTAAGRYTIIERIFVVFRTYILLFFNYAFPSVCYLLEENKKKALRFWKLYNGFNFIFIVLCMIILFVFAEPVIAYFKVESVKEVAALLRLAVFIPVAMAVSVPLKQLVLGWGFQNQYVRLTMFMVILNIAAIIILLPFFNIYGVLAALLITEMLTALLYIKYIKSRLTAV